jgi:pyruvate,water dikinase
VIVFFDELSEQDTLLVGNKCWTLARLRRAGYPVPNGFVILPQAFSGDDLTQEAWDDIRAAVDRLTGYANINLAVRSSSPFEDTQQASFAGQFTSVLNVLNLDTLRQAIRDVFGSSQQIHVELYSQTMESRSTYQLAVIVQQMVKAELAGVVFTVDPLTGSYAHMVGNMVEGDASKLVTGKVDGLSFAFNRPEGGYQGPDNLKLISNTFYTMLERLEEELGGPQDVEWAAAEGNLYIIQSRPITTLSGHNPATGHWNATHTGDFLWGRSNYGEAVPGVLSAYSWSLIRQHFAEEGKLHTLGNLHPTVGNVFGRLYMNMSVWLSPSVAMGADPRKVLEKYEFMYGRIPAEIDIPVIPVSQLYIMGMLPGVIDARHALRKIADELPTFINRAPRQVNALQAEIGAITTPIDLAAFWDTTLAPLLLYASRMLLICNYTLENRIKNLHQNIQQLAGREETALLLAGWSNPADYVESLGLLLESMGTSPDGLPQNEKAVSYQHRDANEFNFSEPAASESAAHINQQIYREDIDTARVETLLVRRQEAREAAWEGFKAQDAAKADRLAPLLDEVAEVTRLREKARSEVTRVLRLARPFGLHAGKLTGLGSDIFHLEIDEVLSVLRGDASATAYIPARKETNERYRSLPPLPAVIRGRFDAIEWATDPARRRDIYDASQPFQPANAGDIRGIPASAGIVEGSARILISLNDASQLQDGEILVTDTINIGWTVLFPRCGAIVTDIGAALSHAAIVARELGIPAVVSCCTATTLLHSGMRIRVDGTHGIITILETDTSS